MLGALIAKRKIRSGYSAVERGDLESLVSVFSEDAIVMYPTQGTMKGKDAIRAFYRHFLETFPQVEVNLRHICVENLFDLIGTNVITVHWEIATTNRAGVTFQQTGMQLMETEKGRVKFMQYFFWDTDHLRDAWKQSERG